MLKPDKQFTIKRIEHAGMTVSSLKEALSFWVDTLGLRLVSTEKNVSGTPLDNTVGVKGAEISLAVVEAPNGQRIELLEYQKPLDRQIFKPRSCDVGSFHIALTVDDLDAALVKIEEAGWRRVRLPGGFFKKAWRKVRRVWRKITGSKSISANGQIAKLVYVRGPDGTTIELQENSA